MQQNTSDEKIELMVQRLQSLKGPGDAKGAFLGNGLPDRIGCDLRSFELAELLRELLLRRRDVLPSK